MSKLKTTLFAAAAGIIIFSGVAFAQNQSFGEEAINSFLSDISVNQDNSIDVTETIVYDSGSQSKHGIYRDIIPLSSQKRRMEIEDIKVTDEENTPYTFEILKNGGDIRIKIGDPRRTFVGEKTYIISYKATNAVAQLEKNDEVYWNVTGNGWSMPIYSAKAKITLPPGQKITQGACYYGVKGSTAKCSTADKEENIYTFIAGRRLDPGEGLTVAAGFAKGWVSPYTMKDNISNFFNVYKQWAVAILMPLLTLFFSLRYWYKKGRDPKGTGVIVPQYDIEKGITPMEAGGIVLEDVSATGISAEIIYLATKGYLKIKRIQTSFGFFQSTDYELTKLKDSSELENDYDKELLDALFTIHPKTGLNDLWEILKGKKKLGDLTKTIQGDVIKMSDLNYYFYKNAQSIVKKVLDALLTKGYYSNLGKMKTGGAGIFVTLFLAIWISLFIGGILSATLLDGNPLPLIIGVFVSVPIYGIILHFSPAKTKMGVAEKEYLLGLKEYLQIAEKNRLDFHNAPEKNPETFEKLLPYAMIFGVSEAWAKEFEGIYETSPSWYSDSTGTTAFSAVALNEAMSEFNTFAYSSLSSSPSGGGSGGGGSSGGGGGGGGGGSW